MDKDKTQTSEARMGPEAKGSYYSPDALATMVAMLSSTYTDIVTVTVAVSDTDSRSSPLPT